MHDVVPRGPLTQHLGINDARAAVAAQHGLVHATVGSKELGARFQRAHPKARRRVAQAVYATGAGARRGAGLHVGVVVVLCAAVSGVKRDAAVQLGLGDGRSFV